MTEDIKITVRRGSSRTFLLNFRKKIHGFGSQIVGSLTEEVSRDDCLGPFENPRVFGNHKV
jgi:hypothetical protein